MDGGRSVGFKAWSPLKLHVTPLVFFFFFWSLALRAHWKQVHLDHNSIEAHFNKVFFPLTLRWLPGHNHYRKAIPPRLVFMFVFFVASFGESSLLKWSCSELGLLKCFTANSRRNVALTERQAIRVESRSHKGNRSKMWEYHYNWKEGRIWRCLQSNDSYPFVLSAKRFLSVETRKNANSFA